MPPRSDRWLVGLAVGAAALALGTQLQDVDPPQYADVAARILRTGEWLALTDMSGPFLNKPPLMMWLQALAMAVLGVGSVAARLPAVLLLASTVGATWAVGRALFGEKVAWGGAALTGVAVGSQLMVSDPKVDGALTAMTTVCVALLVHARARPWLVLPAWLFGALALLSKGPIGLVLPFVAVAPEWLRGAFDAAPRPWWRRVLAVRPLMGVLLVAALSAPFYVAMAKATAGAAGFLLWSQGIGRLLDSSGWKNDTTPLFFTHTALWAYFPFSLALLPALAEALRARVRRAPFAVSPQRVVWWWLGGGFVIISLAKYRLPQYCFWLIPPAALIAADFLERHTGAWIRVLGGVLGLLTTALGAFLLVACFPPEVWWHWAWLGVLGAAAVLAAFGPLSPAGRLAIVGVAFAGFYQGEIHRRLLDFQASEALGRRAQLEEPTRGDLFFADREPLYSVAFYAERDVRRHTPEELAVVVRQQGTRLAIAPEATLEALRSAGLQVDALLRAPHFHTSTPTKAFMLARSRSSVLEQLVLVRLSLAAPSP